MVGLWLGLHPSDLPGEQQVQRLAVAWVRFHQQWPTAKISPKTQAIVAMVAAHSGAYGPIFMMQMMKLREAAAKRKEAVRAPSRFGGGPVNQPGATPPVPNGHDAAPPGNETVILSGVPDGGKLDFGV